MLEEHKGILIVFIAICCVGFLMGMALAVQQTPMVVVETPTPIVTPAPPFEPIITFIFPSPTPTPSAYPTPQPGKPFTFEEYVLMVTNLYYNATLPNQSTGFIDPLSREAYELWAKKNAQATPLPTTRPDDSSQYTTRIYGSPTPTPAATPLPFDIWSRETHTVLLTDGLADLNIKTILNGYLSLSNTRGVYDYYHPGDYAMIQLDFINTNPDPVKNPVVVIEFNRTDKYGHIIPWIRNEVVYKVDIPAAKWNYDRTVCENPTKFSYFYEIGIIPNVIPDNGKLLDIKGTPDSPGVYQVTVKIYNEDKSLLLCMIGWQVNII